MQQLLPDIKALYQRKYIPSPAFSSTEPITNAQLILQRAQRFQQRTASTPSHQSKPASFHIIKQNPSAQTSPMPNRTNSSIASARLKRSPRAEREKPFPSTLSLGPKGELMQLLQVSQQELMELQSSLGGEKTLMSLLNAFFQKRHQQRQQASRAIRATNSQFKPMQNLQARRYQEEKGRQFRVKKDLTSREEVKPEEKSMARQKDLAPWSVLEIDPL